MIFLICIVSMLYNQILAARDGPYGLGHDANKHRLIRLSSELLLCQDISKRQVR